MNQPFIRSMGGPAQQMQNSTNITANFANTTPKNQYLVSPHGGAANAFTGFVGLGQDATSYTKSRTADVRSRSNEPVAIQKAISTLLN